MTSMATSTVAYNFTSTKRLEMINKMSCYKPRYMTVHIHIVDHIKYLVIVVRTIAWDYAHLMIHGWNVVSRVKALITWHDFEGGKNFVIILKASATKCCQERIMIMRRRREREGA